MDLIIKIIIGSIILIIVRYTKKYSDEVNNVYKKLSDALNNLKCYFEKADGNKSALQNALASIDKCFEVRNINNRDAISYSKILDSSFEDFSILKFAWFNYCRNINIETLTSLVHPKDFFNREYLLNLTLKRRDFIKAIPGLITSLGLMGTFVAILLGLWGIDPSNMATINQLVNGLAGKFLSSIAALVCAILFVRNERQKYSELNDKCFELQNVLLQLFPIKTTNNILIDLQNSINAQSERMENTLTAIEKSSLASVKEMVDEMKIQLGKLENQSLNGMTKMVRKFEEVLSQNAVEYFEKIKETATYLANTISDIQGAQEDYLGNMKALRDETEEILDNQNNLINAIQENIITVKEEIIEFSNLVHNNKECMKDLLNISGKLASVGDQFEEFKNIVPIFIETNKAIKELSNDLNVSITHFKEISEEVTNDKINPIITELSNELKNITDGLSSYFVQVTEEAQGIIENQIGEISNALGAYSDVTNEFLIKYDENIRHAVGMLQTNINNSQNAFEENIEELNKNFEKLNKTLKTINTNGDK